MGLSAGLSPGPLFALVLTETLQHDTRAGIKVAVTPIITDLPIILCSVFLLAKISQSHLLLAFISLCGSVFIARMGLGNLRTVGGDFEVQENIRSNSFGKGIIANMLSPHPYLFWLTVGVPILGRAMRHGYMQSLIFLLSFYILLVGSKIVLAVLVGKSKHFLSGKVYIRIMRFLGGALCVLAAALLYDGVNLLFNPPAVF